MVVSFAEPSQLDCLNLRTHLELIGLLTHTMVQKQLQPLTAYGYKHKRKMPVA